jgi:hypothetical protein
MAKVQLSVKRAVPKAPTNKTAKPKSVEKPKSELTGLSLRQIVNATPPYIKSHARDVVVKVLKPVRTKGGLPAYRAKTQSMRRGAPVYDTSVIGKQVGLPVSSQKHVLVSCSCDWFWSHCEFALHHWGSALIKYSNGQPAIVTNPSNHPMGCKHVIAVARELIKNKL